LRNVFFYVLISGVNINSSNLCIEIAVFKFISMIQKEKVNNENGYLLTSESWKIEFYLDKGKEKFI